MLATNGYLIANLSNLVLSSDVSYSDALNQYNFTCILKEYDKISLTISGSTLTQTQIDAITASGEIGYNLGDILGTGAILVELSRIPRGGSATSFKSVGVVLGFNTLTEGDTAITNLSA